MADISVDGVKGLGDIYTEGDIVFLASCPPPSFL